MNTTAAYALALVLTGGPVAMLAPFVIALRATEKHANHTAAVIRRADAAAARSIAGEINR